MGELRVDRRPQAIALGSLVLGVLLLVAKLVAGILTGSLGILSEAAHSALDVAASAFALVAVRTSRRPADQEHPYGHGRVENLAAYTEGLVLLLTALGIIYEAGRRLLAGAAQVDAASYAFVLLIVAMVVEAGRGLVLRWAGRAASSQALTADAGNRWADVASALAVLAGLAGVRLGIPWADAVAALAVGAFIAFAAIRILLQAGDELMDRAPVGAEADLRRAIGAVPGVEEVRAVRVRRSGPRLLGDARIATRRMLSVEGAQSLSEEVQGKVAEALPEVDLVLVVEGQQHAENLVERVHATAARVGQVRDLHNVTVEEERDGTLHLTMHAKLPGGLTLEEAERTTGDLESALREEFPEVSRVDVHLEPLEPELVRGQDVTRSRGEVADRIRKVVEGHPDVVACRDVELSSRDGQITAHVVAEIAGDIPLERAHDIESELEQQIRRAAPEVHEVVARVTAPSSP